MPSSREVEGMVFPGKPQKSAVGRASKSGKGDHCAPGLHPNFAGPLDRSAPAYRVISARDATSRSISSSVV